MEMEVNANEEEEPLQPRFLTSLLGNLAQKHHNPNKHYYVAPVTTVGSYPPPYEGFPLQFIQLQSSSAYPLQHDLQNH